MRKKHFLETIPLCRFEAQCFMQRVSPIDIKSYWFVRPEGYKGGWIVVQGLVGMRPDGYEARLWRDYDDARVKRERAARKRANSGRAAGHSKRDKIEIMSERAKGEMSRK